MLGKGDDQEGFLVLGCFGNSNSNFTAICDQEYFQSLHCKICDLMKFLDFLQICRNPCISIPRCPFSRGRQISLSVLRRPSRMAGKLRYHGFGVTAFIRLAGNHRLPRRSYKESGYSRLGSLAKFHLSSPMSHAREHRRVYQVCGPWALEPPHFPLVDPLTV